MSVAAIYKCFGEMKHEYVRAHVHAPMHARTHSTPTTVRSRIMRCNVLLYIQKGKRRKEGLTNAALREGRGEQKPADLLSALLHHGEETAVNARSSQERREAVGCDCKVN